ncbi:GA-like domain-containing protein [Lysinibacillus sp. UGB7]|uniref:GA-like domain-containing protein n=1 Tax=Lysinibacillus sp. UGB7 TaxID=3411039 RepID=UPI003B7F3345
MKKNYKKKIVATSAMVGAVIAAPAIVGVVDDVSGLNLNGKLGFDKISNQALAFSGGYGTESEPYQVSTIQDWLAMEGANKDAYYELLNDIDFGGKSAQLNVFNGKLNGNGFTIKNGTATVGLFAYSNHMSAIKPQKIENLRLDNIQVKKTNTSTSDRTDEYGVLFGQVLGTKPLEITNVEIVNSGVLINSQASGSVGLLIGEVNILKVSNLKVSNSSVKVDGLLDKNPNSNTPSALGGLIGAFVQNIAGYPPIIIEDVNLDVNLELGRNAHIDRIGGLYGNSDNRDEIIIRNNKWNTKILSDTSKLNTNEYAIGKGGKKVTLDNNDIIYDTNNKATTALIEGFDIGFSGTVATGNSLELIINARSVTKLRPAGGNILTDNVLKINSSVVPIYNDIAAAKNVENLVVTGNLRDTVTTSTSFNNGYFKFLSVKGYYLLLDEFKVGSGGQNYLFTTPNDLKQMQGNPNIYGTLYYNKEMQRSNKLTMNEEPNVLGLTKAEQMQKDFYPTFDFKKTWGIYEGTTLPFLLNSLTDEERKEYEDSINQKDDVLILTVEKAVVKAETSILQEDVDDARTKISEIDQVIYETEVMDWNTRLDAVQDKINAAKKLTEATSAVETAELTKTEVDIDIAKEKVTALPESAAKNALQERLDRLQAELDAKKALEDATKAVEDAERSKFESDIKDAQDKIDALPESSEKDALQDRLNKVKEYVENSNALAEATKAVEKAESTKIKTDIDTAQAKVTALSESAEKDTLQSRLNALKAEQEGSNALDEATKVVEDAEKSKSESHIKDAQDKIDALPDGKDKADLQDRLDKVKDEVSNSNALVEAIKAVEKAESTKKKVDVDAAQTKVMALPASVEKDALQVRLDALKKEVADSTLFEELKAEVAVINKGILDGKIKVDGFAKARTDLEAIRERGKVLTVADNKEQLNVLIDATLTLMELVEKIEGGENTLDNISKLPDSIIKDGYLDEIAASDALVAAEAAVVKVEGTISLADIEAADKLIIKLSPSKKKEELKERLNVVREKYNDLQALYKATKLVEEAEATKRITDIERAEKAVAQLKESPAKADLNARLETIRKGIDDAGIAIARQAVEKAEELRTSASIVYAKEKVNALRPSTEKTELLERIAKLESDIYTQEEMDRLYNQALDAVIKAENSTLITYLNTAISLVGKVSSNDSRKQGLVDRIDAIKLRNQITAVETELTRLEQRPTQAGVEKVQALINTLPDEVSQKDAFQVRLETVKQVIDNENYAKALKAVQDAENAKIDKKRSLYYVALPLVDVLLKSERKTILEDRLAKLLFEVETWEKLDGNYTAGDHVVEAAESIKNPEIKKHLLAWAKAIYDAELYNSNTLVNSLIKVQGTVPKDLLDNKKYADLIEELVQRSEHVIKSNTVFGSLTARATAKKAYIAVDAFERNRTEENKIAAQYAVDDLKRFIGHETQVQKFHERIDRLELTMKETSK